MHIFGKLTTPYGMFESKKSQILIAHQKEGIDQTKKSTAKVLFIFHCNKIGKKKLTLFQPGGTDYAHLITTGTPGFSDLPTALKYQCRQKV